MIKTGILILLITTSGINAFSQQTSTDTTQLPQKETQYLDSTIDYDELFQDFDLFMDSMLSPHSYFMATVSLSSGYYNFESKTSNKIETAKRLNYSPMLAYYHESGFGFGMSGNIINDNSKLNFYQLAITPSFDYLKNKKMATGISFSKYFSKEDLPFYISPLQNELYGYFTWRQSWIKPTLAASYGWGSHNEYQKRETLIQDIRLRRLGYTYINSTESIRDFSLSAALRHDFYWLDVLATNDFIRLSPAINFTAGTQKFGFNQSSSTYATTVRTRNNVLYSTEALYLDDHLSFQPLSLQLSIKAEYSIGRFFIQPQYAAGYYFPGEQKKLTSLFALNMGLIF